MSASPMSFSQSNEEKQFIRLVSGKTIVPLEFPHAYLEFSKDGETFKLNDREIIKLLTKLPLFHNK